MKGKLYPVDVYSVAPARNIEGGVQADSAGGRRGRKQRRAGTQGLAVTSGPAALSDSRTRSSDTISKIKFKQMVGRQQEMQQVRLSCLTHPLLWTQTTMPGRGAVLGWTGVTG